DYKGSSAYWEAKTLSAIPHTKFICRPNSKMSYSNVGYAFLALAMSRAANTPYIKLITEKIFIPLKMNNTYFEVPESKLNYLADGTCDVGKFNHKNAKIP